MPRSPDENNRLDALHRLGIIGTPRATDFDSVLELALQLTGCSVGQIGLIDEGRHWFKAEIGIGEAEIPRHVSLCSYTLLESDPVIVEDLTRDARFRDSPIVTEKGARFYAGVALRVAGGFNVGTLCLIDPYPHVPLPGLSAILRHLGRVVESLFDAHRLARESVLLTKAAEARERDVWKKPRLVSQSERIAKIGSWEFSVETNHFFMSDECYRIHELEPDAVVSLDEIRARQVAPFRDEAAALFKAALVAGQGYEIIGEMRTARGNRRWIHVIAEAEKQGDLVVRVFGTLRDVTTERLAERTLWHAAHYDALTQVPNRHHWNVRLEKAFDMARAERTGLTILILDLDGFKEINDTRGHASGDTVLRSVAQRLQAALPDGSFHARLGGDEFAILLSGSRPAADTDAIVRVFLNAIQKPIVLGADHIQISGTFGSATYPEDALNASDLMQKADIALYQAKRSHRNFHVSFRPNIGRLFDDKRHAIERVTAAIEQNSLVPFYQPKVDLRTNRIIGLEALCRIETADGTILGPDQFQPALLDPKAAARIGTAMLYCVTTDIAAWKAEGLSPGRVALNVTGADFVEGDLARRVIGRLQELRLSPSMFEIEVTENTIFGTEALAVGAALQAMSEQGIIIALDDFGTGYASLTHLRDAPVKYIKLDRSFIAGLGHDVGSAIIVKSIVELGHSLDMRIVAEGVENAGQADFLRAIGCDEAQGFYFGRPGSRHTTRALLSVEAPLGPLALAC